jgi:diguanylate cyclase (GGDEF)-like protein
VQDTNELQVSCAQCELTDFALFRAVDRRVLRPLLGDCPVRELRAGQVLIAAGVLNEHLYLLLSGRLAIHLGSASSKAILTLEPGESVGELSLIDREPTSAMVVARSSSRVLRVHRDVVWRLVGVSHAFSRNLLATLSKRIRHDNQVIRDDRRLLRRQLGALEESRARFKDFAQTAADWFWETDASLRLTYLDGREPKFAAKFRALYLGRKHAELLTDRVIKPRPWQESPIALNERRPLQDVEVRWRCLNGRVKVMRVSATPVLDANGVFRGFRGAARNVTEAHRMAARLGYQARRDALTGLMNRRAFEERLSRVLDTARAERVTHALCYLDLDQFKIINDTCGHVAGDELLRQLGRLLSRATRQRDTLARLGGDEFGLLMERCSLVHARRVAEELRAAVENFRFVWDGTAFAVGVSMGLVPVTPTTDGITELLQHADSACYAAKDRGRNRIHVYTSNDAEMVRRRGEMRWAVQITRALEEERFCLHYQPIARLGRLGDSTHCELLVRMQDESGRLIPPGEFLAAADRYQLSTRLDRWVVGTACKWLAEHQNQCGRLELCAINLSGHTLGDAQALDGIIDDVEQAQLPLEKLCFEVTETAAIANLASATSFIEKLRARGCRFALDDFGSGVSSFAYLKNLPVDFLKIDGAFVRQMLANPVDCAMVRSINEIGHVMGKRTVAEFAENEAIVAELRKLGVDYAQGYGVGRPQPLEQMT